MASAPFFLSFSLSPFPGTLLKTSFVLWTQAQSIPELGAHLALSPTPPPHRKTSHCRDGFGVIHQNYLLSSNFVCASTVVGSGAIAGNQKIKHCVLLEPTVSWGGRPETRQARKICDMADETYHGKKLTWGVGKRECWGGCNLK